MKLSDLKIVHVLCFLIMSSFSFNVIAETANSAGQYTNEVSAPRPSPTQKPESTTTRINFVEINQICQQATQKPQCIMGGTIGFQYIRNTQRMRQVRDLADLDQLKKNAINYCVKGEGDESFILESSKKSSGRPDTSLEFIQACTKIVEAEYKKILLELDLN